jgi:hypothetical protein
MNQHFTIGDRVWTQLFATNGQASVWRLGSVVSAPEDHTVEMCGVGCDGAYYTIALDRFRWFHVFRPRVSVHTAHHAIRHLTPLEQMADL